MNKHFNLFDFQLEYHYQDDVIGKDAYYEILAYLGSDTCLVIPQSIFQTKIKKISNFAFRKNQNLRVLILPHDITEMDCSAFEGINKLVVYTPNKKDDMTFLEYESNIVFRYNLKHLVNEDDILYALFKDDTAIIYSHFLENRRLNTHSSQGIYLNLQSKIASRYIVTGIEQATFQNQYRIHKIIFPESLIWIGDDAFLNTSGYDRIIFPESLERVGDFAFSHARDLRWMILPKGLKSFSATALDNTYRCLVLIRDEASLTKLDLLNTSSLAYTQFDSFVTVNQIIYALFKNQEAMVFGHTFKDVRDITIPAQIMYGQTYEVTEIYETSFYKSIYLKSILLPNSIRIIHSHAFAQTNIKSIFIPHSVISIGVGAFMECPYLEEVELPNQINQIPDVCFYRCISLCKIVLPDSLRRLGVSCFQGCLQLNRIEFPSRLEVLEDMAFYETNLSYIETPVLLKQIGELAFGNIPHLVSLVLYNDFASYPEELLTEYDGVTVYIDSNENSSIVLKLKEDSLSSLNIITDFFKVMIVDGIKYGLMKHSSSATLLNYVDLELKVEVIIPKEIANLKVIALADKCFENAFTIKKISLPNTLTKIGSEIFKGCINLDEVCLPIYFKEKEINFGFDFMREVSIKYYEEEVNNNE